MTQLNLLVIRAADVSASVSFYETLTGEPFAAEKHGNGPEHFSAKLGAVLLEIYPLADKPPSNVRLGFEVADLAETAARIREAGFEIVSEPKDSPWGRRAVVADPDGNRVELLSPEA